MRHRKKGKILDRKRDARKALIRSLANSLILFEKIQTTEAKAKALRPFVEKIITLGKEQNLTNRRKVQKMLYTEGAVKKVFEVLGPKYKERKGGYTRILKLKTRQGDNAKLALIEFV